MTKPKRLSSNLIARLALLLGVFLLGSNVYGLFQNLRPSNFEPTELRFGEIDVALSQDSFYAQIERLPKESEIDYASRITNVISKGIAHIHWERYPPNKFNQTVPFWENYILWAMGKLKVTPEFERYHFSSVEKSVERGIGICGDASMIMSQLLDRHAIENKIITVPGHVLIEAVIDGRKRVFDPDFGVILDGSAAFFLEQPHSIGQAYSSAGYTAEDDEFIIKAFQGGVGYWNGISHFITKKYYFEKVAYVVKWLFPLTLLAFFLLMSLRNSHRSGT